VKSGNILGRCVFGALLFATAATGAFAQSLWWDVNNTTQAGAGGQTPNGTWSTVVPAWNSASDGGPGTYYPWQGGQYLAIFSAGTDATGNYTVTVSGGTINLRGITVEEGNPTVVSGGLSFSNLDGTTHTINVASGSTIRIDSTVSLARVDASITKTNSGTLVLGGSNSFGSSSTINVTGGTLAVANDNALGSTILNMSGGTTLEIRNANLNRSLVLNGWTLAGTGNSTLGGTLTLNSNPGTINVSAGSQLSINTTVNGSGSLQKTGGGVLTLAGSNTYAGNTILAGGTLRVDAVSSLSTGNLNFTGGTLRYGTGVTTDLSQRISNSTGPVSIDTNGQNIVFGNTLTSSNNGGFTKVGVGNLTLSVANTYTGTTTLAGGNLVVNNSGALSSGNLSFTGGTLRYGSGVTTDYSQRIANSTGAVSIDTNGQNVTFGNAISSTNTGGLTKLGNGTLTLSGANAYTGNTTVSAGTLTLGANNVLADSTSVSVALGATLQVGTVETFTSLSGNGTLRLTAGGSLTLSGNSSVGTLWISGNSTLNFGSNSFSVGNFVVDPGVSFQVNSQFVANNWWVSTSNQTNVAFDTRGTVPFNQVTVTGLSGNSSLTFWQSGTNMVTVPEPSTYGAFLLVGVAGVLGFRRWRKTARSPD
jgi:autotransporter-associated beta strand protein